MKNRKRILLKITLVLLVICIGLSSSVSAFAASRKFISPGDINANGVVSVDDVTFLQKFVVQQEKIEEDYLTPADFNGDGVINIIDATEIQKMLADLEYTCFLKADDNYLLTGGKCTEVPEENRIEFTELENTRNLIFNERSGDEFTGTAFIKSKEQFYSIFHCYAVEYDDEFFKDYALIVKLRRDEYFDNSYEIRSIGVDGNNLLLESYGRYPLMQSPMPAYWHLFYRVNKSDVENVDTILNYGYSDVIPFA